MQWQEVCDDPHLKDLPYKIELDEYGRIIMSPQKVYHAILQGEIQNLLRRFRPDGRAFPECAIGTGKGTRVADVVWVSPDRFDIIKGETECSIAPEICIEILSGSNSEREMTEKRQLYFERGAQECWLCDEHGLIRFFDTDGQRNGSEVAPGFPDRINL